MAFMGAFETEFLVTFKPIPREGDILGTATLFMVDTFIMELWIWKFFEGSVVKFLLCVASYTVHNSILNIYDIDSMILEHVFM